MYRNVELPLIYRGVPKAERGTTGCGYSRPAGFEPPDGSPITTLSGGEKQRGANLLVSLIGEPAFAAL